MMSEKISGKTYRWKKLQTAKRALSQRLDLLEPDPPCVRADGNVICNVCKLKYHDHPDHPALGGNVLKVLCSGQIVKL